MKRRFRLTKSADFKRVRQLGKSNSHPLIVLIDLANDLERSRIAVVAGRTVGKAVKRNRAKRLIRAALQPLLPEIKPGWDIIIIARRQMLHATYQETHSALLKLFQRAHLLQKPNVDEHLPGT